MKQLKRLFKKVLRYPAPHQFLVTSRIRHQRFTFTCFEKEYVVEADGRTPVYEIIGEIVDYDCYQLQKIDFSRFDKTSLAVDVGGNIGIFSIVLSAIFPGRIVCFEPLLDNCSRIEHNLKINGITNVDVRPQALSSKGGTRRFLESTDSVGGAIWQSGADSFIEVEACSIDSLAKALPRIDLLKLDCEGGEHEILPELCRKKIGLKYITAEIHNLGKGRNHKSISALLAGNGFSVCSIPEQFGRHNLSCLLAAKIQDAI